MKIRLYHFIKVKDSKEMRHTGNIIFDLNNEEQKERYIKMLTEFKKTEAYQIERYEEK